METPQMNKLEKSKIIKVIKELREEIIRGDVVFPGSENFPLGCCGNASIILLNRLKINDFNQIETKVNMWFNNQSHCWLTYKKYIIDITIDQFESKEVLDFIIEEKTSKFHKQFKFNI